MRPPMWMRLRIDEEGRRRISLWLPVFLLWPLAVLAALLLLPLLLLLCLFLIWAPRGRLILLGIFALMRLPCFLPGLEVDVQEPGRGSRVQIRIL